MQCKGEHTWDNQFHVTMKTTGTPHRYTVSHSIFFSIFLSSPCPALNSDYETRAQMQEDAGQPGCAMMSPSETPSHFTGVSHCLFFL